MIGTNSAQSRICWRIFWSHTSPPRRLALIEPYLDTGAPQRLTDTPGRFRIL